MCGWNIFPYYIIKCARYVVLTAMLSTACWVVVKMKKEYYGVLRAVTITIIEHLMHPGLHAVFSWLYSLTSLSSFLLRSLTNSGLEVISSHHVPARLPFLRWKYLFFSLFLFFISTTTIKEAWIHFSLCICQ